MGCPKVQGVPQKGDLQLNAHKTPGKCTGDKSRMSFGKFRKFPV